MSSPLNFHLEQYEGPLDLLLDLIRKQQINIYDIPIASITAQYMEYIEKAAALDMELGAEFVYMAATLIHIKSKMLLPTDPELQKIAPEEDPRTELVERLIEHEKYKNAAEMLQQKETRVACWARCTTQPAASTTLGWSWVRRSICCEPSSALIDSPAPSVPAGSSSCSVDRWSTPSGTSEKLTRSTACSMITADWRGSSSTGHGSRSCQATWH